MIDAEDILAKLEAKQAEKIAALTPDQRADLERRQAERAQRILEEAKKSDADLLQLQAALDAAFVIEELANKNPDAFRTSLENILGEYTQEEIDAFLSKLRDARYTYLDAKDDDLANIATDNARRQGVESAANLRGILGEIMGMKAQGDRIEGAVGEVGRDVKESAREGAKKAVETVLPKVYAKTANMTDEELEEATKPKTRSHGGGRKKERDLDDAQVKAVLALMKRKKLESLRAYSDAIIRDMKSGKYQNPYTKPKDLDAAVRRYCERTGTPLVFTPRTGKWSATS